jgi:hypothetical protein
VKTYLLYFGSANSRGVLCFLVDVECVPWDQVLWSECVFHWSMSMLCFVSYVFLCSFYSRSLILLRGVCKIIILPVVLYGCETWSLISREECRLKVFENRMLRGIFGPKRDEVVGGCRKLHSEEFHNLHSSPMRSAGHVAQISIYMHIHVRLVTTVMLKEQ